MTNLKVISTTWIFKILGDTGLTTNHWQCQKHHGDGVSSGLMTQARRRRKIKLQM